MNKLADIVVSFIMGSLSTGIIFSSLIHHRDTTVIKMYTEGKIECATVGGEFICVEKKE